MTEKKTTATVNKVDALRPFEIAIKKAEEKRAKFVASLKAEGKVPSSGPWDRLHHLGRWTPEGIAKLYSEVKNGTSDLSAEDQKYLREMCSDVENASVEKQDPAPETETKSEE